MQNSSSLPICIYDGECGFCRMQVDKWRKITGEKVKFAPFQEVGDKFPEIPKEKFQKSVQLVIPGEKNLSGAHAVLQLLAYDKSKRWMLWTYKNLPGFALVTELIYLIVSHNRGRFSDRGTYYFASFLFLRLLGLIYFIAFFSFLTQIDTLIGRDGIMPASTYLERVKEVLGLKGYWFVPSIFWLNSGDEFLKFINLSGLVLSFFLLFGLFQRIAAALLFVFYLSLVSVGQVFMHFQWDILLLEVGFLAIFLGNTNIIIWLYRWLLFRFVFLSGVVKLASGDPTWRTLSALNFHFETQPLPTVFAWYAHQLPEWAKKFTAGGMFFIELFVPFLIFAPRNLRLLAAFLIILLEGSILLTGNYNFFNLLTIFLCIFLFDDNHLSKVFPWTIKSGYKTIVPKPALLVLTIFIVAIGTLQIFLAMFKTLPSPTIQLLQLISPLRIVNSYGVFAVMTTTRNEIIIEGSEDGKTWLTYEFKYKPGDLSRTPVWVAPHQPRVDWQMWFAALSSYQNNPWFVNFTTRLLQGSPPVTSIFDKNPFSRSPPRFVRALFYEYHFTSIDERVTSGNWWKRELKGLYLPVASLSAIKK